MIKPYQIDAGKCLVISDIHQEIDRYAKLVVEREKGNYDHVIFLGDFIDSHKAYPQVAGVKETARFVKNICEGNLGPATLILSNHDAPYMESWSANQKYSKKRHIINFCSGFTNKKSIEINKILSWEDWRKFQLFCEFGGFVLSHGGINKGLWNFYKSREENLDALWNESDDALRSVSIKPSRLFAAGQARGGREKIPGIIWQDWLEEHEYYEELGPELLGHTPSYNCVRRKGKSFVLDGIQTTYALLDKNGGIEFKSIIPGEVNVIEETGWQYNGWVN
jgi:3',5'-cyclic AMP phosphodiesterase CpdA